MISSQSAPLALRAAALLAGLATASGAFAQAPEDRFTDLALPVHPSAEIRLDIDLGLGSKTIVLRPESSRTTDFRVVVADGYSSDQAGFGRRIAAPAPTTMSGFILGEPHSLVSATVSDGQLHALVHDLAGGTTRVIEPAAFERSTTAGSVTHIVREPEAGADVLCGCTELLAQSGLAQFTGLTGAGGPGSPAGLGGPTLDLPIAFDTLAETYDAFGGNTTALIDRIDSVLHHASVLYEAQVGVRLLAQQIVIRTDASATGYPYNAFSSYSYSAMAFKVRDVWSPGAAQPYGYAHLFTPDKIGSIAGAQVADICKRVFNPHVSSDERASSWGWIRPSAHQFDTDVKTLAHEIGHGFSISHSATEGFAGLMAPNLGFGTFQFHPVDLGLVHDWINAASNCYVAGTSGFSAPTVASVSPNTVPIYPAIGDILLQGAGLDGVFSIEIAGTVLDYSKFDVIHAGLIKIHSGLHVVPVGTTTGTVMSPGGTGTFDLTVTPVATPTLTADSDSIIPFVPWRVYSMPNGSVAAIYSLGSATFPIAGWPLLQDRKSIHTGFLPLDGNGHTGIQNWFPDAQLVGQTVWVQAAVFDTNATFDSTTNIVPVLIY